MMVERRWPTCISLAMFGEEKSMTTRSFLGTAGGRTPLTKRSVTREETNAGARKMLMNPGPATSHCEMVRGEGGSEGGGRL